MSRPKVLGMQKVYIPNSKADARYRIKFLNGIYRQLYQLDL